MPYDVNCQVSWNTTIVGDYHSWLALMHKRDTSGTRLSRSTDPDDVPMLAVGHSQPLDYSQPRSNLLCSDYCDVEERGPRARYCYAGGQTCIR